MYPVPRLGSSLAPGTDGLPGNLAFSVPVVAGSGTLVCWHRNLTAPRGAPKSSELTFIQIFWRVSPPHHYLLNSGRLLRTQRSRRSIYHPARGSVRLIARPVSMRGAKNFKLFWRVSFLQDYLLNSERLLRTQRSRRSIYHPAPGEGSTDCPASLKDGVQRFFKLF